MNHFFVIRDLDSDFVEIECNGTEQSYFKAR